MHASSHVRATAAASKLAKTRGNRARPVRLSAAVNADGYKYLSKAEIPSHIPRDDFIRQMTRWAIVEFTSEDARRTYGCPFEVQPITNDDGETEGFKLKMLKYATDGTTEVVEEIMCAMDDDYSEGYDMIARNADGFPEARTMDGQEKLVLGKNFVVQRKEKPITPEAKAALKDVLTSIAMSTNKYYAFGSNFSDEF